MFGIKARRDCEAPVRTLREVRTEVTKSTSRVKDVSFVEVLEALKTKGDAAIAGCTESASVVTTEVTNVHAYREAWKEDGLFIKLQQPGDLSKMTEPYLYLLAPSDTDTFTETGKQYRKVPWFPNQADLLANDWRIVTKIKTTIRQ